MTSFLIFIAWLASLNQASTLVTVLCFCAWISSINE
jgi:hypothetical protein